MKIIIFDIDGTLLLTGGVGIDAFNRAFSETYDVPSVWNHYDPHGKTDQEIITDLTKTALGFDLSHLEIRELAARYIRHFCESIDSAVNFRVLPGVLELLKALSEKKYALGIATGNFKQTAEKKLERGKLSHFFSFGGFASDSPNRLTLTKTALNRGLRLTDGKMKPEEVVLVGDARQDIECGKALGMRTVAVATGSLSKKELAEFKPDLLLDDLTDLNQIISFIDS